jgi:hypothetical protein
MMGGGLVEGREWVVGWSCSFRGVFGIYYEERW